MKKPFLVTISAAALVSGAASCSDGSSNMTHNPPPPEVHRNPPMTPDPVPSGAASTASSSGLPKWEDIPSPHPVGATNPPSPFLIVTPEGACYKVWEGGMIPGGPDRVENCGQSCKGTHIECTSKATTLLAAYRAAASASASASSTPPSVSSGGPVEPPKIHRNPPPPTKK
ncbi:MAG: hypothetical protein U0165_03445 [Polyangiaceae bacterium]